MGKFSEIAVLEKLNAGLSDEEVAKLFDRDPADIAEMRASFLARGLLRGPTASSSGVKMSGAIRQERRKAIAAYVDAGHSHVEAAAKFGCSTGLVGNAVSEYGTKKREVKKTDQTDLFKIAAMFVLGRMDADIAKEIGISRERVGQLRNDAEAAGFFAALKKFGMQWVEEMN